MDAAASFSMTWYQQRNRQLEAECAELREEIRQLRDLLAGPDRLPKGLPHLTNHEGAMLRLLIARQLVTREMAMMAIYQNRDDAPESKIIDLWVHRLRRKLAPLDIGIETIWGQGWRLSLAGRVAIEAMSKSEGDAQ